MTILKLHMPNHENKRQPPIFQAQDIRQQYTRTNVKRQRKCSRLETQSAYKYTMWTEPIQNHVFYPVKYWKLEKIHQFLTNSPSLVYFKLNFLLMIQDMKNVCFPDMKQANLSELKEISVIHACRNYSRWSSNPTTESLCSCNGSCITKCCRCRKNGWKCSTRCHHNSTCCQNKFY